MQRLRNQSQSEKRESITECLDDSGALPSEHEEQRLFISLFRKTFPAVRIIAIPNGGWRDIRTAARLKAEGVSAGVPDLFIPAWRLWIEMKRRKRGTVSAAQKDWIKYLKEIGHEVFVCYGADEAYKVVTEWREEHGGTAERLGQK